MRPGTRWKRRTKAERAARVAKWIERARRQSIWIYGMRLSTRSRTGARFTAPRERSYYYGTPPGLDATLGGVPIGEPLRFDSDGNIIAHPSR